MEVIQHEPKPSEVKRFYFPATLIWTCEECGKENKKDFSNDYLGYPTFNEWRGIVLCCSHCDNEQDIQLKINLTLEVKQ